MTRLAYLRKRMATLQSEFTTVMGLYHADRITHDAQRERIEPILREMGAITDEMRRVLFKQ